MIPLVSVVGTSDSGKTFLLEKIVPRLTAKGYRIATVKHDVHGFDIDREGKDSWRHKQAGALTVVLSSPDKIAVIKDLDKEQTLEEIRRIWIRDADMILTEGYKRSRYPKIEVSLFKNPGELLCTSQDDKLIAVVTNESFSLDVPVFRDSEIDQLVDLLEERFLKQPSPSPVEIALDGEPMVLSPFVSQAVWKTFRAFLSTLKGWDPAKAVEIRMPGEHPNETSSNRSTGRHE